MEVMGAAASVAGLLSLAMQLVDTSNQVISFCESVRNAPSELERLMRLFLNVQGIAIDAQNVFGEFQRMHKDGRRAIFPVPGIAGALEECIEIVNEMKQEVNKVDGTTWAKIKFVFKTQTISEYEKRLGDSLQRFHVRLSLAQTFHHASERAQSAELFERQESMFHLLESTSQVMLKNTQALSSAVKLLENTSRTVLGGSQALSNVGNLLESTHETCMSTHAIRSLQSSTESSRQAMLVDFQSAGLVGVQRASVLADQMPVQLSSNSTTDSKLVQTILGAFQITRVSTTQNMRIGKTSSQTKRVVTTYSIFPKFWWWSVHLYGESGSSPSYGLSITPVLLEDTGYDFIQDLCEMPCSQEQQNQKLNEFLVTNKAGLDCHVRTGDGKTFPLSWLLITYIYTSATSENPLDGILLAMLLELKLSERGAHLVKICFFNPLRHRMYLRYVASKDIDELDVYHMAPRPALTRQPWNHEVSNLALDTIEYAVAAYVRAPFLAQTSTIDDIIIIFARWWPFLNHQAARRLRIATSIIQTLKITNQQDSLESLFDLIIWSTSAQSRIATLGDWLQIFHQQKIDTSSVLSEDWSTVYNLNDDDDDDAEYTMRSYVAQRPYIVQYVHSDYGPGEFRQAFLVEPSSPVTELLQEFDFCAEVEVEDGHCDMVLQDFPDLIPKLKTYTQYYSEKCFVDLFEYWKSSKDTIDELERSMLKQYPLAYNMCRCNFKGEYVDLWPFCGWAHTMCGSASFINTTGCIGREGGPKWCEHHRCRFNHERFARKQARKEDKKLGWPEKKLQRKRVPGAWVE